MRRPYNTIMDATSDDLSHDLGKGMKMTLFGIKKKFPSVKDINTATLSAWMGGSSGTVPTTQGQTTASDPLSDKSKLIILDARPVEEYEISHLPGAVRVDHGKEAKDIIADVPDISDTETSKIVCYCSVGYRSSMVAEKLSDHYKGKGDSNKVDVYNLEGSIFQWANEGRLMVDGQNKPTIYAHPYNTVFGMLLKSDLRKKTL